MAGAGMYVTYICLLIGCSLGISVLALRLGRQLTPAQENPLAVRAQRSAPDVAPSAEVEAAEVEAVERVPVAA
ncbi:hypothetical protein GCM10020000_43400 [Streptomyces olivoverticillatus]